MSTTPTTEPLTYPPTPDGRAETWVYLRDWPMPPDAQRALEIELQAYPFKGKERLWLEDDLKLCYLFPDQWVAIKRTDRSLIVLMAGDLRSPEFVRFRGKLGKGELQQVLVTFNEDPYAPPETRI